MKDFSQHIIRENATIKEALIMLNRLGRQALVLFVIDENDVMTGSLTDGDIRRKLVTGTSIETLIKEVMHLSFKYISQDINDVYLIRSYKELGITLLPFLDKQGKIIDIYDLRETFSILPIDAVLMAGGKGERLRPLTEKTPKPLLPIGNKTIIDYNIDRLLQYGIKHISISVNYLKEQLEKHFEEEKEGVKMACVREPKFLGTIGSVKFIKRFYHDTVLVMNSDLFTNINYEDFYLHFKENNADMSVAAVPYSVSVPYGIFDLNGHTVKGIIEKPTYNYYANAGIYLIKKELLSLIPDDTVFDATDFMELLISLKKDVVRFPITGYWIDIGKKEDYAKALEFVKHL